MDEKVSSGRNKEAEVSEIEASFKIIVERKEVVEQV